MKGFFDKESIQNSTTGGTELFHSCAKCGLYKDCLTPDMKPCGNFKKGILNIGEAPGEIEDRRGKPWQGKAGRRLKRAYKELGFDLFEDCLNINSVSCRPPENRNPTSNEISHCRGKVIDIIKQYKPNVIVVFGNSAIESVLGHRIKKNLGGITKWRGWTAPDRELNAWVCPVHHPSFVQRQDFQEVNTVWMNDLDRAMSRLETPIPEYRDEKKDVQIFDCNKQADSDLLCTLFDYARKGNVDYISFDYETTGLKPHRKGHHIVCASFAYNNKAFAFMIPENKIKIITLFKKMLTSPKVGKMAHNMKFEENWSVECLNTSVYPWAFDSMQAAHMLDNRRGITGLKFQTYVKYGVIDYNSHIDSYLVGTDKKDSNSFNRIYEFIERYGEEELLMYCGLDSLFEYKLALDQMNEISMPF